MGLSGFWDKIAGFRPDAACNRNSWKGNALQERFLMQLNRIHQVRKGLFSLFLGGMLLIGIGACSPEGPDAKQAPTLEVLVTKSVSQDVPLFLDMVGTTLGTQDVSIRARVEGFLETMDFEEGTFVKKGALLYTIDPQPFQAKLVEAQSQLAAAKTNLAKAESDLARIRPLAEIKAVSEQDLDGAIAQEAAARAGVQASEAAVDLAEINLSYTRIMAPIDGLIGLTKARPGEFVGREPNPVVLTILSDIEPIRVRFSISEREYLIMARTYLARQDRQGRGDRTSQKADLALILADGSEHEYKGKAVAAAQSIDQETGTYTVEATFPNPDRFLLPGQFARVRAMYQVMEDVVVIPRMAVSELQNRFRVYVVNSNNVVGAREVTLGPQTGNDVVVESGLEEGETVIVEGIQKVRKGMTVIPQDIDRGEPSQTVGS
jgi:membrane fusion protein (multidrug efflux system)